jgi:hypothetical protein
MESAFIRETIARAVVWTSEQSSTPQESAKVDHVDEPFELRNVTHVTAGSTSREGETRLRERS